MGFDLSWRYLCVGLYFLPQGYLLVFLPFVALRIPLKVEVGMCRQCPGLARHHKASRSGGFIRWRCSCSKDCACDRYDPQPATSRRP